MISALKLRQDPSPHLSKLFSSEYPSAATFLVDTPTDVLPKKNRRYGVDDLDARVNEIANAIQRTAGKASLGDRICFIKENHFDVVVLAVAISRAGFVPIVVSDSASDDDFQALVAKTNPKLVLLGGRFDSYTDHQIQALSIERPYAWGAVNDGNFTSIYYRSSIFNPFQAMATRGKYNRGALS